MKTILVVDDFATMRKATHFSLQFENYQVLEAADGRQALEILHDQKQKIDMLITDINMPGMDGLELVQQVRADQRLRFMPILVLTTQNKEQEAKKAGATAFIRKPFDFNHFLSVIKRLLR